MSDNKLYRKYIGSTVDCCEEDNLEEKKNFMNKIKKSKYLQQIDKKLNF